jgi:hypothetical protein
VAEKERLAPVLLMAGTIAVTVAVIVACSGPSPTAPSGRTAGPTAARPADVWDGTVTTMASPITFPIPVGGGDFPIPVGGGDFPIVGGGGDVGPTPPPTPTPTADPSAAPSGTPTPPPTPTPTPCPPTFTVNAPGTPRLFDQGTTTDDIIIVGGTYGPECRVKDVRISLHVTTATGFVGGIGTSPGAWMIICGEGVNSAGVGFAGCGGSGPLFYFSGTATGNELGSNCSNFVFDTTAATPFNPLAPGAPPYAGTYGWDFDGRDSWFLNDLQLRFAADGPDDMILQCATLVFTTEIVPFPSPSP